MISPYMAHFVEMTYLIRGKYPDPRNGLQAGKNLDPAPSR